jgi:hypothetical protein
LWKLECPGFKPGAFFMGIGIRKKRDKGKGKKKMDMGE